MRPTVQELAGDLTYAWPDFKIQIELSALHQTEAGAVRGMINVTNGTGGPIYWNSFSLTGATDRKTLREKLEKSAGRAGEWELDVDRMCQDAYKRHVAVPEPVRLADVQDQPLDVSFLFDPLLPEGQVTLFLADQGSSKSYLMLYLCACIALGLASVFGKPSRSGPVIFFDWEVDERTARRRLAWICRGLGVDMPRDLYYVNMCERGRLIDVVRDMRYMIEKIGAVMAVVDSLTFATGGDLSSTEWSAPTMSAIGSLGNGVTKLVSSHPNKASRNGSAAEINVIGSALFEFRARAIWILRRLGDRAGSHFDVRLVTRKPFDGRPATELAYRVAFDNDQRQTSFAAVAAAEAPMTNTERIRYALNTQGNLDTNQLAQLLGMDPALVRKTCDQMTDVHALIAGGGRGKTTTWTLSDLPWWGGTDA